jgi:Tol biopolymer transport system component
VCRRYNFTAEGDFSGWRIGRINMSTRGFEFLRPEEAAGPFELNAQELADGKRILFELRARPPASGVTIHTRDLKSGAETMLWTNASRPVVAPDGDRVVYSDTSAQYRLRERRVSRPDDPAIIVSNTAGIGRATWSADGKTIVYTVYDQPKNCDHLERVTWSGSEWSAPERVRDCGTTGEFLTDAQWIDIP